MSPLLAGLGGLLRRLRPRPAPAVSDAVDPLRAQLVALSSPSSEGGAAERVAAGLALLDAERAKAFLAALDTALAEDGAPAGRLGDARDALWATTLGLCWLRRAGLEAPPERLGRWISGVDALYRLQGEQDGLPGLAPEPAPALATTLARVALAWGLDSGSPPPGADPLAEAIAGPVPGAPAGLSGPRWAMWTWRTSGLAVVHGTAVKRPARLFADAREGRFIFDLAGLPVLWTESSVGDGDGAGGALEIARIDGRKVRLAARGIAWSRAALLEGARLVLRDAGLDRVAFHPGKEWALTATETGARGVAGGLTLEIKLEAGWRWTVEAGLIQGTRGSGPAEIQSSFELRT